MEAALLSAQGSYHVPNVHVNGYVCKTNLPSNTAMRGFGMPEALLLMETIMSHVADTLKVGKAKIQELNFVKDGQEFLGGMKVENCTLSRCWTTLLEKCSYNEKRKEIEEFNK